MPTSANDPTDTVYCWTEYKLLPITSSAELISFTDCIWQFMLLVTVITLSKKILEHFCFPMRVIARQNFWVFWEVRCWGLYWFCKCLHAFLGFYNRDGSSGGLNMATPLKTLMFPMHFCLSAFIISQNQHSASLEPITQFCTPRMLKSIIAICWYFQFTPMDAKTAIF